jgi:hypothetical protein
MNDGGALYCWAQNEDYTHHNTLRGNIIINAVGSCVATANDLAYGYGIYTDNNRAFLSMKRLSQRLLTCLLIWFIRI